MDDYASPVLLQYEWVSLLQGTDNLDQKIENYNFIIKQNFEFKTLHPHKCLRMIRFNYDSDAKTSLRQKVWSKKIAQNFKTYSFAIQETFKINDNKKL